MKQRYEEKILVISNTTLYEALVQGMLAQGWDRVQTIINDRKKERYIYAIFRREIHWCSQRGCNEKATEQFSFTLKAPEALSGMNIWLCADHAPKPTPEPEAAEAVQPQHSCAIGSCLEPGVVPTEPVFEGDDPLYYCEAHVKTSETEHVKVSMRELAQEWEAAHQRNKNKAANEPEAEAPRAELESAEPEPAQEEAAPEQTDFEWAVQGYISTLKVVQELAGQAFEMKSQEALERITRRLNSIIIEETAVHCA